MRRTIRTAVAVLALLAGSAGWAPASQDPIASEDPAWTPVAGGWVSGPVEHVTTIPLEAAGGSDAVVHDGLLYVSSFRSFSIYDVSDPVAPVHLVTEPLLTGAFNEMPQTNGEILLLSRDVNLVPRVPGEPRTGGRYLDIWDVSDPRQPQHVSSYRGPSRDHIWTCVLDCSYAYSSAGTILDLREPATPAHVGDWSETAPYDARTAHAIDEVAPGIVLTGSLPIHVLDGRRTPASPELLASFRPEVTVPEPTLNPSSLVARLAWPDALDTGRLAVVSMETPFTGPCTEDSGDVQSFTIQGDLAGELRFTLADRYHVDDDADRTSPPQGTYTDGAPPYNLVGCGAYGLAPRPGFGPTGGTAAVAFFEHGVRLLRVGGRGELDEIGGFLPLAGNSTAPTWVTDDVLYVVDLQRGVDVLRIGSG